MFAPSTCLKKKPNLSSEFFEMGLKMPLLRAARAVGIPPHKTLDVHNTRIGREVESPSSNGVSNARSLAAIGAVFTGPSLLLSEKGRLAALKVISGGVLFLSLSQHFQDRAQARV